MDTINSVINSGGLHSVGSGYVIENMKRPSNVIKVFPIDLLHKHSGTIENADDGDEEHGKVTPYANQPFVEAIWAGSGDTERVTAPYMRKGNKVELYRLGTTDKYYWKGSQRELDIAKKDYSLHMWSNLKDKDENGDIDKTDHTKIVGEQGKGRRDATTMVVDQEEGIIELATPNNDEEKAAFNFKIDMKKGLFHIDTTRGSKIHLDAAAGVYDVHISSINMSFSKMTLNGGSLTIDADTTFQKKVTFNGDVTHNSSTEHLANVKFNSLSEDVSGTKLK